MFKSAAEETLALDPLWVRLIGETPYMGSLKKPTGYLIEIVVSIPEDGFSWTRQGHGPPARDFHLEKVKTFLLTQKLFTRNSFLRTKMQVAGASELCFQNNPFNQRLSLFGVQRKVSYPAEVWQLDFTPMLKTRNIQYLVVCVNTFTEWSLHLEKWEGCWSSRGDGS